MDAGGGKAGIFGPLDIFGGKKVGKTVPHSYMSIITYHSRAGTTGQIVGNVPSGLSLTSPKKL
jgi:hypothetical protein